jgi:hypothetical protein
MKNSNDTIGNRTRDLLACSAVPQPTAQPLLVACIIVQKHIPVPNFQFWLYYFAFLGKEVIKR